VRAPAENEQVIRPNRARYPVISSKVSDEIEQVIR